MKREIILNPKWIIKVMLLITAGLAITSFAVNVAAVLLDVSLQHRILQLVNLDVEASIPTWYQAITLLLCAIVLSAIAFSKNQENSPWFSHWRTLLSSS